MSALPEQSLLSRAEARSLTDDVKNDAERLWRKLVELYEGGAHTVLGYSSWGAYFKEEFGGSSRHGYELLKAGRVVAELSSAQLRTLPKNEGQARELAPLIQQPEKLREAWVEVVEAHPEPTAADVREVVATKLDREPTVRAPRITLKDAARNIVATATHEGRWYRVSTQAMQALIQAVGEDQR